MISSRRRGREWIEFVDLGIAPRRVARFKTEWVAREAIGRFLGIDSFTFDLIIDVRDVGAQFDAAWQSAARADGQHGLSAGTGRGHERISGFALALIAPPRQFTVAQPI